uniref:TGF-beta family profile domain-containing protein n=1 Tax=Sphaeramia orbicularis TaxID=375764 RepID=A0A672YKD1_9TELE
DCNNDKYNIDDSTCWIIIKTRTDSVLFLFFICFVFFLDCVHFSRNPVHTTDRKSIRGKRSPEMEDFLTCFNLFLRSPASHGSFLCELRRFLADVLPRPDSPPISLDSLHSLPPLTIGPSSSESLLAGLMNSSAPTVFSFSGGPSMFQVHRGELALPPALLEELSQRLEQMATHTMEAMKEEEGADRATRSLDRLHSLCVFPKAEPAAGERQYRAFLLLKALQTVARSYEVQRALRATRADHDRPPRSNVCSLRSLTVSLERYLVGPNTAAINNCHGACAFPMLNGNNHAVLLNSHIEGGNVGERAPCCVPVAYEGLEVVDLNEHGTYLTIKPDMVAKECGCR